MEEMEVEKEETQTSKSEFQTQLEESLKGFNAPEAGNLVEGTVVQVVRNDKKMPVLVYARETLLALNRADCEKIEVTGV